MARITKGEVAKNVVPKDTNRELFVTSVVRSKSGPEGWYIVDNIEILDLFYKDAINYHSLKLLVDDNVSLCLSKQSNPIDYPDYSIRLNNNRNIPVSYPISTESYESAITGQGDVGRLIMDENYTFSYKLTLTEPFSGGDYVVLPLLDSPGFNTIIYQGDLAPIPSEHFRGSLRLVGLNVIDQLIEIKNYLSGEFYESEIKGNSISIWRSDAMRYLGSYSLANGTFEKDTDLNHKLLVNYSMASAMMEFTPKIYGVRANDIIISISKVPYTTDYVLEITLDSFKESFLVEFNGGTNHYVEDVLMDSILINCKVLNSDFSGFDPSGIYYVKRLQDELPLYQSIINWTYEESISYLTNHVNSILSASQGLSNMTLNDICSVYPDLSDRIRSEANNFSLISSWLGNPIDHLPNINLTRDLSRTDLMHYLVMDDGMANDHYTQWLDDNILRDIDAYLMAQRGESYSVNSDRVMLFSQELSDKTGSIMSMVPSIKKIYSNDFLGIVDSILISEPEYEGNINQYINSSYHTELIYLINTLGQDMIETLLISNFSKRLSKNLDNLYGMTDNYSSIVNKCLIESKSLCPLIDSVNLMDCSVTKFNTLGIRINLKVKRYSTGIIYLNFNINI